MKTRRPEEAVIEQVGATSYCIPTETEEADGTLRWEATEVVVVHIRANGQQGMGYSYTAGGAARALINDKLSDCLLGRSALDLPALWMSLNNRLRNIGRPGLGLMAISAVDVALWDLKAKLLDVPLVSLWGRAREAVPAYGSGGFINHSDERLKKQLRAWLEQGFRAVKIKLGPSLEEALRRVELARSIIGPDIELMVDANGAYQSDSAPALAARLEQFRVRWLEEPVPSNDLSGLRRLRDRSPPGLVIAAGEYGWDGVYFRRMLEAGAVDVLQVDATRCGYTGFLQAAHLCETFSTPLSAHCAPALHACVGAVVPQCQHLEYFHDHVRVESTLFDHDSVLENGQLTLPVGNPGHGITLRRNAAEDYLM